MYTLALNYSGAFHSHLAWKDPNKHSRDLNKYIKNKTVLYLSLESKNFASQLNMKHLTKYKYQEELKSLKHVFFPSLKCISQYLTNTLIWNSFEFWS